MPQVVDHGFLATLDKAVGSDLGRYGLRYATVALRERSLDRLHDALLASALSALMESPDARECMVGLALHYVVARDLGSEPLLVFETVARRLPDGEVAQLLRDFGARQDVTSSAFGWVQVETDDGPDFLPI
jgi:hypothetical protein